MIRSRFVEGTPAFADALAVRQAVFVDEQGFSPELEQDEYDAVSRHVVVYNHDGRPAACGRLVPLEDGGVRLGRIAVLQQARGQGLGDLVMRLLLRAGLDAGRPHFLIDSQADKVGFYARYGFEPCGEDHYDEHVLHTPLRLEAGRVDLAGKCCRG